MAVKQFKKGKRDFVALMLPRCSYCGRSDFRGWPHCKRHMSDCKKKGKTQDLKLFKISNF